MRSVVWTNALQQASAPACLPATNLPACSSPTAPTSQFQPAALRPLSCFRPSPQELKDAMLAAVADGSLVVEAKPVKKRSNPTKPAAGSRKRSIAKSEWVEAVAAAGASQGQCALSATAC